MKKHVVKNGHFPVVLVASFLLLILAFGLIFSKPFKILKEVVAVGGTSVGELNLNASGTTFTPGGIWKSDGTVGIGTTAPGQKLSIIGDMRTTGLVQALQNGGDNYMFSMDAANAAGPRLQLGTLSTPSEYFEIGAYNNRNNFDSKTRDLRIYNAGGVVFLQNSSGNVGFGTTGPNSKLELWELTDSKPGGVLAADKTILKLSRTGTPGYTYNENAEFRIGHGGPSAWGSKIDLYVNGASNTSGTPDQQAMTWDYNGNIGIGTVVPTTKLEVNDQTSVSAFTGDNDTGIRIHSYDSSSNNYALLGFTGYSASYNRNLAQIGAKFTGSGSYLSFGTSANYGTGITNEAMVIDYNGYVGIGTAAPGYKLDVAGTVYASGSSRDYKQDIKNLEVDSSKIYNLQPVSYDYKKEYKNLGYTLAGGRQFGLIAEDAYKVIPELVISKNDKKTANIDYEKLSVLLLAELKKLKITVDQQQKQINELQTIVGITKP
ncbi:MAG: tail fiber domain-containing protein [Patescibacteria group bacterium]|jgi:hypothetical protein